MAYTTIAKPTDHSNVITYTGTGSSNARTGVGHQPDLVWIKNRESTSSSVIADSTRGVTKYVSSDANTIETTDVNSVTAFGADGFTVGSLANANLNTEEFAAWCWKANGGTTSSNTSGSTTSTVQANTTAGFSIVTWAGTSENATIGHGLGVAPKFIIVKNITAGRNWLVYHGATEIVTDTQTDAMFLNTTTGWEDDATFWNDTVPTSTVFSVGTNDNVNESSCNMVAYCFTPIKGYSHFGVYTGMTDNADGPMAYCGFRPKFVLIKRTDGTENWEILDTARMKVAKDGTADTGGNPMTARYKPNTALAENAVSLDFYSTGFKPKDTDGVHNWTDYKYIYAAFAEMPVVGTNGTIALAR